MKGIGVNASSMASYVDHIVPLSQLMNVPVLCTYPEIATLIDITYPSVSVICDPGEEWTLDGVLEDYDVFFYVNPSRKPTGTFKFADHVYEKGGRGVCGFHGYSDKKETVYWLERFADEDIVLAYGQRMLDFFERKGILNRLRPCIVTGNYRYEYYLENQAFLDGKISHYLFPANNKKTILYAPTWTHPNRKSNWRVDYSSFFHTYPYVLDHVPVGFQVLVKLHPMLLNFYPDETEEIKEKYADNENIRFISDTPLIYPLLSKVDLYIGDYSSVGYDFLAFDRPLYLLSEAPSDLALYKVGTPIYPDAFEKLYQILDQKDEKSHQRIEAYRDTFGERKSLKEVKREIEAAYL